MRRNYESIKNENNEKSHMFFSKKFYILYTYVRCLHNISNTFLWLIHALFWYIVENWIIFNILYQIVEKIRSHINYKLFLSWEEYIYNSFAGNGFP